MSARSVKQVLTFTRTCIKECWEAQVPLDDEDEEYKRLDEQIKAYQDVHRFLAEEDYDGEDDDDDKATAIEEAEPEDVLPEKNEESEDDEDAEDGEDDAD